MAQHSYLVAPGVQAVRADKALAFAFPEHSRVALQRAFDAGLVALRGRVIKRGQTVKGGDEILFDLPEVKPAEIKAVKIPLEVLFEDQHLLAVNKAPGMIVHPGAGTGEDTLVHALLAHCAGGLSGIGGVERPGIVHRLDRETSGIILVAKSDQAHRGLAKQFAERSLQKEYLALVGGAPGLVSGSILKPIGRNKQHRHKMAVIEPEEGGRDAHTDWEVVEKFGEIATLMRCFIHTGRTHQIRVHLKSLGHILLGDSIYGWKADTRLKLQPPRVMLHAEHLIFTHPVTSKTLDLRAPLPVDFTAMIKTLRTAVKTKSKQARRPPAPPPTPHIYEN